MPALPLSQRERSGKSIAMVGGAVDGRIVCSLSEASALRDADMVGEATHERFAARELVDTHPFVRLMRLRDVSRTAEHRGNCSVVEQRRFASERYLAEIVGSIAGFAKLDDFALAIGVETRHRRKRFE